MKEKYNMGKKLAVGIDIGGTNSKFGVVDRDGNILAQSRIKTQQFSEYHSFIEVLKKEIEKVHPLNEVIGIGVGAPNANYYKGTIVNPPNLPWKGVSKFAEEVEKVFGLKCVLTNDANAAALGEMVYGKAKNMKDFVVLTVGTGLGSGIVINGDLVYGKHGFAGELGHTLVNANGRHCACGKRGCLETYVSATGIRRTVYKLLADYTDPSMLRSISFDDLSTRTITEAAAKGDKIAIEAFKYTGRVLGMKLSDFIVHTDPEAIFLLGGLSKAGDYIFTPAQENMEHYLMPLFRDKKIKLQPSGLKDDDAPILGASSLVWKYIDK
ncbi:ROK family protein [Ekhidna sp.]|uniref:ROK family protein n=1 Tax=Ekhidna sp. TaxID=2608089 RepID=UPI0032EBCF40